MELQKPFAGNKTISNSLQTNGTLLTDEWCSFLKKNNFMVGISIDGPKEVHDCYRTDRTGNGTFDQVMRGLRLLQKHNEPGLHYLCEGYNKFFLHIREYCHAMPQLLEHGQPVSLIMDAVKGPLVITLDELMNYQVLNPHADMKRNDISKVLTGLPKWMKLQNS